MGCLYKITSPSEKAYIGITLGSFDERWKQHQKPAKPGRRSAIKDAISKHGAASMRCEVLVIADDAEYLAELERKAIVAFGTLAPNGYNLTGGGESASWHVDRELHKASMKEAMNRPEVKAKCIESAKKRVRTAEYKARISEGNRRAWEKKRANKHVQSTASAVLREI
jgi:group I intron endonuclease